MTLEINAIKAIMTILICLYCVFSILGKIIPVDASLFLELQCVFCHTCTLFLIAITTV